MKFVSKIEENLVLQETEGSGIVKSCYITVFNNEVIKMAISRTLQDSLLSKLQNIRSQRSGGVGSSYFDTNQISRGSFAEFDHLVTTVTYTR